LLAFVNEEVSAIERPRQPSRTTALVMVVLDAVVVVSVSVEVAVVVSVPEEVDAVVDVRVTVVLLVVEEIVVVEVIVVAVVVSEPEEIDVVRELVTVDVVGSVIDVVVVVCVRRKTGKMGPGTLAVPWRRTMAKPIVAEGAITLSAYREYQEEWQHSRSSADQSWCFFATVPTSSNFVPQSSTNHTL